VGIRRGDRSPFGLWDTGGNVAEWTSSLYCNYADASQCKPGVRATRGGSFDVPDPGYLRTTFRDWVKEETGGYNLGFRCAFNP
jgi:formylglycine-generating enzyme required for sulfatase activity